MELNWVYGRNMAPMVSPKMFVAMSYSEIVLITENIPNNTTCQNNGWFGK